MSRPPDAGAIPGGAAARWGTTLAAPFVRSGHADRDSGARIWHPRWWEWRPRRLARHRRSSGSTVGPL